MREIARAYYNEFDRDAAHVLRCLIADGLIAPGDVDDRSIKDVQPDDLAGYTQIHLFAGAGLWSVAARLAGWPDDRPLWSASCPCQPFSAAGKGLGVDDPRHLWPDVDRLVRGSRERGYGPAVLVGEQVAGAPGYHWFNGVRADLAQQGYRARVVDIPACAVDAPHIRQRLYWCALGEPASGGRVEGLAGAASARYGREPAAADQRINGAMADARRGGDEPWLRSGEASGPTSSHAGEARERQRGGNDYRLHAGGLALANADAGGRATATGANASGVGLADACREGLALGSVSTDERRTIRHEGASAIANHPGSVWRGADWILCHDGKARRTEPGLRLLVDGMAGRISAWRLGGNSIVAPLAAEVIAALMDVIGDRAGPKRPAPMTLLLEAAE